MYSIISYYVDLGYGLCDDNMTTQIKSPKKFQILLRNLSLQLENKNFKHCENYARGTKLLLQGCGLDYSVPDYLVSYIFGEERHEFQ